jgi:hypothetical protein
MERTQGEKNFIFDLMRCLDPEIYYFLWRKINLPRINLALLQNEGCKIQPNELRRVATSLVTGPLVNPVV